MKNKLLIFIILSSLLIVLVVLFFSGKNKTLDDRVIINNIETNTWNIEIGTWNINKDIWDIKIGTWVTIDSNNIDDSGEELKILTIEDKINMLITKEEVIELLEKNNDWNYLEEIPRIESYYTQTPFYEFYFFNAIKDSSINECNKIDWKEKEICIGLFESKDSQEKFIESYKKIWESDESAQELFNVYKWIENKSCSIGFNNIIYYLMCEKMLDTDLGIKDMFIKYSIFETSNLWISKKYYEEISDYWKMNKWFKNTVGNNLYPRN